MSLLSFTPFPELQTQRLLLRQIAEVEAEALLAIRSDPQVNAYLDRKKDPTLEDVLTFIRDNNVGISEDKWLMWGIYPREETRLIGTACLWNFTADEKQGEVGYELLPQYQGKGIMREAISRILEYGFQILQLKTIVAVTHSSNLPSHRFLLKLGFVLQAGQVEDSLEYVYVLSRN